MAAQASCSIGQKAGAFAYQRPCLIASGLAATMEGEGKVSFTRCVFPLLSSALCFRLVQRLHAVYRSDKPVNGQPIIAILSISHRHSGRCLRLGPVFGMKWISVQPVRL
jgi:hypothetical protein